MTSKKGLNIILQTLGPIFYPYFQGIFPDFQGFCEDFHGFCHFQELCPDFRQFTTFEGALSPPPPIPLDLQMSSNLLFKFSK